MIVHVTNLRISETLVRFVLVLHLFRYCTYFDVASFY